MRAMARRYLPLLHASESGMAMTEGLPGVSTCFLGLLLL